MNKLLLFALLLPTSLLRLHAQSGEPLNYGARAEALANSVVTSDDLYSLFANQAGMADTKKWGVLAATQRRFNLNELSSSIAGIVMPINAGSMGLTIQYYGYNSYNEKQIGLAYGRRLFEKLTVGAKINLMNFAIADYGNITTFNFELGMQSKLLKNLIIGAHITSPIQTKLSEYQRVTTLFKFGAKYIPNKKISIAGEVEKSSKYQPSFKAGIEYAIIEALQLRIGGATNPTLFSFGLGYKFANSFAIDFGASYHQILGFTPSIGLSYQPL